MGTYDLPRSVKGEGRILFIFTGKSLIYTVVGAGIGWILLYFPLSLFGLSTIGIVAMIILAAIGFGLGTLKVPEVAKLEFSRKTGGENVDDIIKRAFKFMIKGKKLYIYKEGKNNG